MARDVTKTPGLETRRRRSSTRTALAVRLRRSSTRMALAALAAASALLLTGCAGDPLAEQYREGSGKNYIAGDGTISEFAEPQRGPAVAFSGETVEGGTFDSADTLGDVILEVGKQHRVEAPILEEVSQEFGGEGVTFVGVNVRDQAGTAASFEETYGVTYPSILDVESGTAQLAFAGPVPAAAVPTTIVLDQEGRVAARVLGQLTAASTLESIIDSILAEQA